MTQKIIKDVSLVNAAVLGDQTAVDSLLALYQKDIRKFARHTCRTAEDAEDAVQTTLWQIHKKINTLQALSAFTSWLFKIVERECRRLFRLNRLNVPIEVADIENMLILDESRDLRYDLSLSIQKLPEMYCRVLILRDIQELTAPETADLLNISVDAVKSRLHRARKMLREELMENGAYIRGIK